MRLQKHTVAKIRSFYQAKTSCEVDIYYGASIPEEETRICALDDWLDRLIVFRAAENEKQALINAPHNAAAHYDALNHKASRSTVNQPARSPLRPVNGSVSVKAEEIPGNVWKSDPKLELGRASLTMDSTPSPWGSNSATPVFGAVTPTRSPLRGISSVNQTRTTNAGLLPSKPLLPEFGKNIHQDSVDWKKSLGMNPLLSGSPEMAFTNSNTGSPAHLHDQRQVLVKQEPYTSLYPPPPRLHPAIVQGPALARYYQTPAAKLPPAQTPNDLQNKRLQKLLAEGNPDILEAEVRNNIVLLDQLQTHIIGPAAQSAEAQQWLQQIESLKQQNVNEPTVIGVVGNTGAGKSSVINAMLDEERLVPSNCVRACTAVPTEMSWNSSENENAKYRAEIEFIKPEDWERELRILFEELLEASGRVSRDASNEESEAGIAYAKIKAVYPNMTHNDISESSVTDLMQEPSVRRILGTTRKVEEARSDVFYRILQTYVDSKEKTTDDKKKQKKEMEFWP